MCRKVGPNCTSPLEGVKQFRAVCGLCVGGSIVKGGPECESVVRDRRGGERVFRIGIGDGGKDSLSRSRCDNGRKRMKRCRVRRRTVAPTRKHFRHHASRSRQLPKVEETVGRAAHQVGARGRNVKLDFLVCIGLPFHCPNRKFWLPNVPALTRNDYYRFKFRIGCIPLSVTICVPPR